MTRQEVVAVDTAKEMRVQRQGAAAGFVALALGIVGASFERGAPGLGTSPEQVAAFLVEYRRVGRDSTRPSSSGRVWSVSASKRQFRHLRAR
jgi:hypothetical protein